MLKAPVSLDPDALADWIEFNTLFGDGAHVAKSDIRRPLEALNVESRRGRGKTTVEALLGAIARRVTSRAALAGDAYPIKRSRGSYGRKGDWDAYLPYSFALLCTLSHHYAELALSDGQAKRPAELLGLLSTEAIAAYLAGSAVRFDAPRRAPVPQKFRTALEYLGRMAGEPIWSEDFSASSQKDDGLDVVAWKPFSDGRGSQVLILAQCAVGKDWSAKLTELDAATWSKHVRWHVDPIRAFVVPFQHGGDLKDWERMSTKAGVVFDRSRLARLTVNNVSTDLRAKITPWCVEMADRAKRLA
jgi:hypothetical protein